MRALLSLPLLALTLNAATAYAQQTPAPTAAEALRAYYATLPDNLPVAPANPALPDAAVLTRIAFGSCLQQDRHQTIWDRIAAANPQLFLMIGDNVYGDTATTNAADIPTLTQAYARLAERAEFAAFRTRVPMMTTWDDHDFGANDAGGSFAFKERAEAAYEAFWNSPAAVRARPGVYDSRIIGPVGQRVQIILLDTRFFRSDLARMPYRDPSPALGWYVANNDPAATVLGDAQWRWLEEQLRQPAELRIIASSTQVLTQAHNFESWANFPRERERLLSLIAATGADNSVLISGDRHQGGLYRGTLPGSLRPIWEITSSSLNLSFLRADAADREPDPLRTDGMVSAENFALIDIDWASGDVSLALRGSDGAMLATRTIPAIARRR